MSTSIEISPTHQTNDSPVGGAFTSPAVPRVQTDVWLKERTVSLLYSLRTLTLERIFIPCKQLHSLAKAKSTVAVITLILHSPFPQDTHANMRGRCCTLGHLKSMANMQSEIPYVHTIIMCTFYIVILKMKDKSLNRLSLNILYDNYKVVYCRC